jgi:GH18 family chitinase
MKKLTLFLFLVLFSSVLMAQRFHNQKIVGYIPDYGDATNVDYSNLTHALFCFLQAKPDGSLAAQNSYSLSQMNAYFTAAKKGGAKKIITLWGDNTSLTKVGQSASATNTLVDTIVKYCAYYGFEGVDIDWEGLSNAQDSSSYTKVMTALHNGLTSAGLTMSATVTYGNYWGQWFPDQGLRQADWLQIMVYSQTGGWSTSPYGDPSTFQHIKDAENYWVGRGYPRAKLVMGIPFYGTKFQSTAGGMASDFPPYKQIVAQYPNMCDSLNETPGTDYTFFNGPAVIRQKCRYLIENNFGGVMIWEMTQDATGEKSLFQQIVCTYSDAPCTTKACSTVSGINDANFQNDNIKLYPNPIHESFRIDLGTNFSTIVVKISNTYGEEVYHNNYDNQQTVIIDKVLPPGIYLMNLTLNGVINRLKLLVE